MVAGSGQETQPDRERAQREWKSYEAMGRGPPTLPKGTAPSGGKKGGGGKKHTVALVFLGLAIGSVIILAATAMRGPTESDLAMCADALTEMRRLTLLIEQEHAKAEGMIDMVKAYHAAGLTDGPEIAAANSLATSNIERAQRLQAEFNEIKEVYDAAEHCN